MKASDGKAKHYPVIDILFRSAASLSPYHKRYASEMIKESPKGHGLRAILVSSHAIGCPQRVFQGNPVIPLHASKSVRNNAATLHCQQAAANCSDCMLNPPCRTGSVRAQVCLLDAFSSTVD
ncbi:hypothetical protein AND_008824 [Anopheles darlingi]|uniref:Uncharacterized protein n=1 Tax=Anopheles darlingi TaxID=43151 RepID=W5J839_ANODA|nr:hypothetical protein AND_008824 [Anopheles darlingi]